MKSVFAFLRHVTRSGLHRLGAVEYLRSLWEADLKRLEERTRMQSPPAKPASVGVDAAAMEARMEKHRTILERQHTRWKDLDTRMRQLEADARLTHAILTKDREQFPFIEGWLRALRDPAVGEWVRGAVSRAEVGQQPMPHMVVRDLWPPDVYEAILQSLPDDVFFADLADQHKPNLRAAHVKSAPLWFHLAWRTIEEQVIPEALAPALAAALAGPMADVYRREYGLDLGSRVATLEHRPTTGRLMLRRPGYRIEPHLDPQRVTVTCLLYLARAGDDPEHGTELYSVEPPPAPDTSSTFYPRDGYRCERVKSVAFVPNTALVFLNRIGAHGAHIPDDASPGTRRFAYQFYISPDATALERLRAESGHAAQAVSA